MAEFKTSVRDGVIRGIDTPGSVFVCDLLKGESLQRWLNEFGEC